MLPARWRTLAPAVAGPIAHSGLILRPANRAPRRWKELSSEGHPFSSAAAAPPPAHEPSAEEKASLAASEQEHAAMVAPTAIRSSEETGYSSDRQSATPGGNDLANIAQLTRSLSGGGSPESSTATAGRGLLPQADNDDYYSQNEQGRKQAFLEAAATHQTDDYLRSTREAPLSSYEIKAGWEIPAVLEQGLNSDLPGELKALVTVNVYDTATGQFLLIPQGSRLIGKYDSRVSYGQSGVQVVWNRIIFPDASSVDLNGMEGLDAQGNAGLRDKVDRHYKRLFGSAALSSLFSAAFDVSQRQNQSVLNYPSPTSNSRSIGKQEYERDRIGHHHAAQSQRSTDHQGPGWLPLHSASKPRHLVRWPVRADPSRPADGSSRAAVAATLKFAFEIVDRGIYDEFRTCEGSFLDCGSEDRWPAIDGRIRASLPSSGRYRQDQIRS